MTPCMESDCPNIARYRGRCWKHQCALSELDRFEQKYVRAPSGCWIWTANLSTQGYGRFKPSGSRAMVQAHRYAYELHIGPIPDGLQLDHLCRVRSCVNPLHLQPVRLEENVRRSDYSLTGQARKKFCAQGHPRTPDNVSITKQGHRRCMECNRLCAQRWREARRGIVA